MFRDRTLFLTGAGGAIGRLVARSFHESGANIFLTDLRAAALEDFAASLGSRDRVRFVETDVGEPAQVADAVGRCVATFGCIDFVVPMAGLYPERAFAATSVEEWKKTIDINLTGVFLACREAVSSLRDNSAIVLVSSIAAHRGSALHAHYAAAKGGVLSLMRSLAIELAPKTRVNAVSPGIIATEMTRDLVAAKGDQLIAQTPLRRFGRPEEIAAIVQFLCSDAASFITGETIHANGGLYIDG